MIVTAPTWRQLVLTLRQLEKEKTKGYLKRSGGMWIWKETQ